MDKWKIFSNKELVDAYKFYALANSNQSKELREEIAEEIGERGSNIYELLDNPEEMKKFRKET